MVARTEDPEARSRKMSRRPRAVTYSPVTRRFRELFATHAEAERRKLSVDEIAGERQERAAALGRHRELEREQDEERRLTRRRLLVEAGTAGALVAGFGARSARAAGSTPRIAIVGAGLAGIRCAHMLWTGGLSGRLDGLRGRHHTCRRPLLAPARLLPDRARRRDRR